MGEKVITGILALLAAVIGIAIIAVLVSKSSNTANVLSAAGKSFSGIVSAAVSPVTGGSGSFGFPQLGSGGLSLPGLGGM
jgi:PRD1 phage membrane DNA delivery